MGFGKPAYIRMAFNLCASIKYHGCQIPIRLIHDGCLDALPYYHKWVFDVTELVKDEHLYHNGKLDPGRAKTRIYEYLQADSNIYLDVDAMANQDLTRLFDYCEALDKYYLTQVVGKQKPSEGRDFKEMQWAYLDDIVSHYKISEDAYVWATNSSFAYIRKSPQAEALFAQIQANIDNPLPNLRSQWGDTFPDELALNVALAQLNHDPSPNIEPVYFNYQTPITHFTPIIENHFLMGYFGGEGFSSESMWEYYDRQMRVILNGFGFEHEYKSHHLIKDKHANKTRLLIIPG